MASFGFGSFQEGAWQVETLKSLFVRLCPLSKRYVYVRALPFFQHAGIDPVKIDRNRNVFLEIIAMPITADEKKLSGA